MARSLTGLVDEFELNYQGSLDGVEITGVTVRTDDVIPGDLFVGLPGAHRHGAEFAEIARERGAVALLTDLSGAALAVDSGLPVVVVDAPRAALGGISAWVYRTDDHAPLIFGITGTNGKTSTAYFLEAILKTMGLVTGLSTTSERHIGELSVPSRLTTPEASELHAMLARMRESEVRAAVIEVSAQALSHHRVDGILFDIVAFTNLSHDHLDDYRTMEEYFEAKLSFFELGRAKRGVVLVDSPWGQRIVENSHIPVTTVAMDAGTDAEWRVDILEERPDHTAFELTGPEGRSIRTNVPIIGRHMAADAALAIVMMVSAGFELEAIGQAIGEGIPAYLPGRVERVSSSTGPTVYVDYGHTPEAFRFTLDAVRRVTHGKVIMVFGADGDRDSTKRNEMGRVASELSDLLIVTDYHPRFEDAGEIRSALIDGAMVAQNPAERFEVSQPEQAIRRAVKLANNEDSILWAGPGDESYRDVGGERLVFSARDEARAALQEAGW